MQRREIIYLALSNLIANTLEALEGINKLPQEQQDIEEKQMLEYIVSQAIPIEEEYRNLINEEPTTIDRPNWDEMGA